MSETKFYGDDTRMRDWDGLIVIGQGSHSVRLPHKQALEIARDIQRILAPKPKRKARASARIPGKT